VGKRPAFLFPSLRTVFCHGMSSEQSNYETFRDSLSVQVVSKLATGIETRKTRARNRKKSDSRHKDIPTGTESGSTDANSEGSEAEELAEFVDVAAPS
jgi:hypothetical protein